MPKHNSVALLNMPIEFINIIPINPLISKCEAKILYHGKNRNRSYIAKAVANAMANSLPNIPIVGEFLEEIGDYSDHAEEMVITSKGIKFRRRTSPIGVVPADTKIWWQWFCDDDGVEREYLMCECYIWTGRYPETRRILEYGNGQSMELDQETLSGHWATFENESEEYFIIDEAIFSALCVLGENVEPCFESASVTAPKIMYSLNKDEFKSEMTQFMLELKEALNSQKGGEEMPDLDDNTTVPVEDTTEVIDETVIDTEATEDSSETSGQNETEGNSTDFNNTEEPNTEEIETSTETEETTETGQDTVEDVTVTTYNLDDVTEYQELKGEYEALLVKYNTLVSETETLKTEYSELKTFKEDSVKAKKEQMIQKFNMLDESDLKDVKENLNTYSLEDIEAKLSVIAVRKKVNFNLDDSEEIDNNTEDLIVSYSVTNTHDSAPAWIKAVEARKRK